MISRQFLLALSLLLTMAVHAALFAFADRIHLTGVTDAQQAAVQKFRVKLRPPTEQSNPTPEDVKLESKTKRLFATPGNLENILKREQDGIQPLDSLLTKATEIPQLADRAAAEVGPRAHAIEPTAESLQTVDARIVEISQDRARQDIEIARRLVTPTPTRILGENEFPTFGGAGGGGDDAISFGNLPVLSLLGDAPSGGMGRTDGASEPEKPAYEELLPMPGPAEVVSLPDETRTAPAQKVVDELKKENPFEFMDNLVDVNIDTWLPPLEKEGYFRLRIMPKKDEAVPVLPKDVTLVIDASTSIVQYKLDATIKGAKTIIQQLRPDDRFNVVVFRDTPSAFTPEAVPATQANRAAAASFMAKIQSRGETNVYNAIRPVIQSKPRKGVASIILVMTDGRPTAGVRDARAIINALSEENVQGNTVFAYGSGNTVNRYLLDLLAYRNKGESRVLQSIEGVGKDLPQFFSRVNDPLLVQLRADYGHIDATSVFPKEVPDFYRGRAVTVYGRFDPAKDKEFSMRLSGLAGEGKKEVVFKTSLKGAALGTEEIARSWAFQKIYYLVDRMCMEGEKTELLTELRELSAKYNIKTSYDE